MQKFRDLKLIGNPSELERLIEKIEALLGDGWTRAKDKEEKLKNKYNLNQFIFLSPKDDSIPRCTLHLTFDQNEYLYICNLVPIEMIQLEEETCNLIFDVFRTKFIEPAVNELDIRIVTTPAEINIDNSMSPELSAKLQLFSDCANKSTGYGHPLDQQRFFDFVIQAHRESSLLDKSTLRKLLLDQEWSKYFANDISSQYSFDRDLLKQYDS